MKKLLLTLPLTFAMTGCLDLEDEEPMGEDIEATGTINADNFRNVLSDSYRAQGAEDDANGASQDEINNLMLGSSVTQSSQTSFSRQINLANQLVAQTEDCQFGGTKTVDENKQSETGPTPGDSTTVTFAECMEEQGETANGIFTLTLNEVDSTTNDADGSGTFDLALTAEYNALTFIKEESTTSIDGSSDFALGFEIEVPKDDQGNATGINFEAGISNSGDRLSVTKDDEFITLTDFEFVTEFGFNFDFSNFGQAPSDAAFTVEREYSFFMDSSDSNGTIKVESTETITRNPELAYPQDGQITVTGAEGQMVVDIVNAEEVLVSLDFDNDGEFEETDIAMTWDQLAFAIALDAGQ